MCAIVREWKVFSVRYSEGMVILKVFSVRYSEGMVILKVFSVRGDSDIEGV